MAVMTVPTPERNLTHNGTQHIFLTHQLWYGGPRHKGGHDNFGAGWTASHSPFAAGKCGVLDAVGEIMRLTQYFGNEAL